MSQANTVPVLEAAIVARLKAKVPQLAVELFPAQPKQYRLTHRLGALLVAYRGARYGDPQSIDTAVVQEREIWFDVHVLARNLGGPQGITVFMEAARLALVAHRVKAFSPIRAQAERFLSEDDGVFTFALTVSATTQAFGVADPDELLGALLEHITLNTPHETTEVPA